MLASNQVAAPQPAYSTPSLAIPLAFSPYMEEGIKDLPEKTQEHVRKFAKDGYVVVDIEMEDRDQVFQDIEDGLRGRYPEKDRRVAEGWYDVPAIRKLACAPFVIDLMRALYGRRPLPFQTLNFDVGTGQAAHSDTIHFHCTPKNFMAGAWVALEDTDAENGPLFAYPGSHKLPDYDMTTLGLEPSTKNYLEYERRIVEVMEGMGIQRKEFHVKKGQAIIWAANLVHGGTHVIDTTRTRQSQVTHYYFEDGMYYFPMGSDPMNGAVIGREVIDLVSGEYIVHKNNGVEFPEQHYDQCWRYERPLPDWIQGTPDITARRSAEPETAVGESSDDVSERMIELAKTVESLQAEASNFKTDFEGVVEDNKKGKLLLARNAELKQHVLMLAEDNAAKDAFIKKRDDELSYKIARRITKTCRALLGKPKAER